MLPLTPEQVRELRQAIQQHWTSFEIRMFGPEAVGIRPDEVYELVRDGILDPASIAAIDPWKDAYLIGYMRDKLTEAGVDLATASWSTVRNIITASPMPLTALERAAIGVAKQTAGIYAAGLGNRLENAILSEINLEDLALRAQDLELIQSGTAEALAGREGARTLASRLADLTGDYGRDWQRLATTELHEAQEHGYADYVEDETGGDSLVAKITNPDACPACMEAYRDADGRPRIFTLDELRANGTNVGRPRKAWLPVVGTMHPYCDCRLSRVPDGFEFDDGDMLVPKARRQTNTREEINVESD